MTSNIQDSGVNPGCGGSFAPPSILEYAFTNIISGQGLPGTVVKLTDGGGVSLGSVTVRPDGNWSITLDRPTENNAVLRATAYDPATQKTSAAAQVVVGGARPEVTHCYAGLEGAFGTAVGAIQVFVYGPDHELLGWAAPDPRDGAWLARYSAKLNPGDTVMIYAQAANGMTSLPIMMTAQPFTVTHRTGRHIGGSGAEPGSTIIVYNAETGGLIDQVDVNADGDWSLDFREPLASGSRVSFYALNSQGLTTNAVTVVLAATELPPPEIQSYSTQGVSGQAPANTQVYIVGLDTGCGQTINVDGQGQWTTVGVKGFKDNEVVFARTLDNQTQDSSVITSVTISQKRPNPPIVESVEASGASGTAVPGTFVYAAVADKFSILGSARVGGDGRWRLAFPYGTQNGQAIAFNSVADLNMLSDMAPDATSINMVHIVGQSVTTVETPEWLIYNGETFAGTEATANTVVKVYRDGGSLVGEPAPVDSEGNWATTVSPSEPDGEGVYAIAEIALGHSGGSPTSQPTKIKYVDTYKPEPPVVTGPYPDVVSGTEAGPDDELPKLTIYIAYADASDVAIGHASVDANHNWVFEPAGLSIGDNMVAWAQTDAGNKSAKTPFTILGESQPVPPQIYQYNGNPINGSSYVDDVTIDLHEGSATGTSLGTDTLSDGDYYWSIDVGGPLPANTKLYAIATDANGGKSDPGVENVNLSQPNYPQVTGISNTRVSGYGDGNTIAYAYSADTGKKLGSATVSGDGVIDIEMSPEQLDGALIIIFLADSSTGSQSPHFRQVVGYSYP